MPYLIGTDEAGYGPNLGPLVIGATVWRVPGDPAETDLYQSLERAVCSNPRGAREGRLFIADSKAVYQPGKGLAGLERAVLIALGMTGSMPETGLTLWQGFQVAPDQHGQLPWPCITAERLPIDCSLEHIKQGAELLHGTLQATGISLVALHCTTVFPARFNHLTERYGTKGEALSRLTLQLVTTAIAGLNPEPTLVLCDRHGGRSRYGGLLQDCFPDHFVEVRQETPTESAYRWGPPECRTQARFCVGGESHLPIALASMTAKYIRELSMRAFNAFWCTRVAKLAPTAGYPVDARRFKQAIAATQAELGIADDVLWRNR